MIEIFMIGAALSIFIRLLIISPSLSGRGMPGPEPPVPRGMPSDK